MKTTKIMLSVTSIFLFTFILSSFGFATLFTNSLAHNASMSNGGANSNCMGISFTTNFIAANQTNLTSVYIFNNQTRADNVYLINYSNGNIISTGTNTSDSTIVLFNTQLNNNTQYGIVTSITGGTRYMAAIPANITSGIIRYNNVLAYYISTSCANNASYSNTLSLSPGIFQKLNLTINDGVQGVVNASVDALDYYNGRSLSNFTVTATNSTGYVINGTTTSGLIYSWDAVFLTNTTQLWNLTFSSNDGGGYFNTTLPNQNMSTLVVFYPWQAEVYVGLITDKIFNCNYVAPGGFRCVSFSYPASGPQNILLGAMTGQLKTYIGNLSTTNSSVVVNATNVMKLSAGTYSFVINGTGSGSTYDYPVYNNSVVITPLSSTNLSFYNSYDSVVNVSITNSINGSTYTSPFSATVAGSGYFAYYGFLYSETFNLNSTSNQYPSGQNNGAAVMNYNVSISSSQFFNNISPTFQLTSLGYNLTMSAYPAGYQQVNFFSANNGSPIKAGPTGTIYIQNSTTQLNFSGINSTINISGLVPGNQYNVICQMSSGYANTSYVLSYPSLSQPAPSPFNCYMSPSASTITFTVQDPNQNRLTGVLVSASQFVNGTMQTLCQRNTDVTGVATCNLFQGVATIVTFTLPNYVSVTLSNSLESNSYGITMNTINHADSSNNPISGVYTFIQPTAYDLYSNQTLQFNFTVTPATGINLTNFSISIYDVYNNLLASNISTNYLGGNVSLFLNLLPYNGSTITVHYEFTKTGYTTYSIPYVYNVAQYSYTGTPDELRAWIVANIDVSYRIFLWIFLVVVIVLGFRAYNITGPVLALIALAAMSIIGYLLVMPVVLLTAAVVIGSIITGLTILGV